MKTLSLVKGSLGLHSIIATILGCTTMIIARRFIVLPVRFVDAPQMQLLLGLILGTTTICIIWHLQEKLARSQAHALSWNESQDPFFQLRRASYHLSVSTMYVPMVWLYFRQPLITHVSAFSGVIAYATPILICGMVMVSYALIGHVTLRRALSLYLANPYPHDEVPTPTLIRLWLFPLAQLPFYMAATLLFLK